MLNELHQLESRILLPGELFTGRAPTVVKTVLGSCVAVTMRDPASDLVSACHAIQPCCPEAVPAHMAGRYADSAIVWMVKWFAQHGIDPARLETKLFGGAAVLQVGAGRISSTIGRQNIDAARSVLRASGIILHRQDVGGTQGRRLYFDTRTGDVYIKRNPQTVLDYGSGMPVGAEQTMDSLLLPDSVRQRKHI